MPNKIVKKFYQRLERGVLMALLQDNQLIQLNLQACKVLLDVLDVRGDGNVGRMVMLPVIETLLAEQLLVVVFAPNLFADEVDVFNTAGARCRIVLEELFLSLNGKLLGLHMLFFIYLIIIIPIY
jgi:hypothetical protein